MRDEILKHIKDEKDVSRYKISVLKKRAKNKAYKHRLISIEKDFIEYPIEKIEFRTLAEAREAITLFKVSRLEFIAKYGQGKPKERAKINAKERGLLDDKVSFYENKYKNLLEEGIKKLNILEDDFFASQVNALNNLDKSVGPDTLMRVEGASLGKKRARAQILLYCFSRFLYYKVKRIKRFIEKDEISTEEFRDLNFTLDNFLNNYEYGLFNYYNDGIKEVPLIINGTLGHNNYIHALYPLTNLFEKYEYDFCIEKVLDENKKIFNETSLLPSNKKFAKRGYAVITPMQRVGNEAIKLLFLDLWSKSGVCLNEIFTKDFYNQIVDDIYYKAISTVPMWTTGEELGKNKFLFRIIASLLGLEHMPMINEINFKDASIITRINNYYDGNIEICSKSSKILVPTTRSEADHIKTSLARFDLLIKEIREEYISLFLKDNQYVV